MSHQEISRPSRAVTAKKCNEKCNGRGELLFWLIKSFGGGGRDVLFAVWSPSPLLKLPPMFFGILTLIRRGGLLPSSVWAVVQIHG